MTEVSAEQDNMTLTNKKKLEKLLKDCDIVFDGKLGLNPYETTVFFMREYR